METLTQPLMAVILYILTIRYLSYGFHIIIQPDNKILMGVISIMVAVPISQLCGITPMEVWTIPLTGMEF